MGVWIETKFYLTVYKDVRVTPCVGVWIETDGKDGADGESMSHPAWVCGLKQDNTTVQGYGKYVTPCVGVWIETWPLTR